MSFAHTQNIEIELWQNVSFLNHTLQQDELVVLIENQKNFSINSALAIELNGGKKSVLYDTQNFGGTNEGRDTRL